MRADDLTGREVERALLAELKNHDNVQVFEDHLALDLIVRDSAGCRRRCLGVFCLESHTGVIKAFISKVTFLATGGCGQVYLHTTNPSIATGGWCGDGVPGRGQDRQHGVHPVPPDSPVSGR